MQTATAEIQTRTTKIKMTTTTMKKKEGKVVKRTRQVETSLRGHQTRRVEQGPWGHQTRLVDQGPRTPLERAPHGVSTQDQVKNYDVVIYVLLKLVGSTFSLGVSVLFTIVFTKNNNVVCAHVKYYVVI